MEAVERETMEVDFAHLTITPSKERAREKVQQESQISLGPEWASVSKTLEKIEEWKA